MLRRAKAFVQSIRDRGRPYFALFAFIVPYRKRFTLGLIAGALFGVTNGALPFVLQQVSSVIFYSATDQSFLGAFLRTHGVPKSSVVLAACLVIPAVMVLRGSFSFLNSYLMEWVSMKILMDLRSRLLKCVMAHSLDFFNKIRAGEILSRIMNETQGAQGALTMVCTDYLVQPISLCTGIIVLLRMNWQFTVATLALFPLCIFPVMIIGRRIRHGARREEDEKGEMMVLLHEILAGIRVVKAFSRTRSELARFEAAGEVQFRDSIRIRRDMESLAPIVEGIAAVGVGLALYYVYHTQLPGSTFISLCLGIFLLYQPIKVLSRSHLLLQRCVSASTTIFELLNLKPTVADAPDAIKLGKVRGELVFDNVSFSYRAEMPALEEIRLTFQPGRYYALVGASGAGKSTMLSLILRFYDPVTGRILLDGQDLRAVTQDSLRNNIGIVSQETFLFHQSIHENIAYGKPDATREEVIAAAKEANAHEFIQLQPDGYDTVVGDKGCLLSGGQQQRLAIARALLKNPPLLLLDEATSALDSESERLIQAALERLASGRTVIAIAHRLSTILKADSIIVLHEGRVRETGTHRELIARSGLYRRLYDLQFQHGSSADEPAAEIPERTGLSVVRG